jgi:serine/threonine-protein kinase RsbW
MPKDTVILTVPNDISYLPVIAAYVRAVAVRVGLDDADVSSVRLAVEEACAHVIATAFKPGEAQDLTISCQTSPTGLLITVADQGSPFDPRSIPEYDAHGGLDRDLTGLPFHLIQQAMDEVHFVNRGWKGKELQLTKYLRVPGVETYFTEEELRPYDTTVDLAAPGEVEYRLMEQSDAVEVARCIYKTYGYTYPSEHVYFPERVVAMNQSGEMISAVAVTTSGEVIGHCALSGQPGDPLMECGEGVVDPSYRDRGVLNKLGELLLAEARQRRLPGLYAQAITRHPFSQKAIHKFGFREAALLLARFPAGVQTKEISDQEIPQRETVVYGYLPFREEPSGLVYAPAHHRPMLERIYDNLGLERTFAPAAAAGQTVGFGGLSAEVPRFSLSTRVVSLLGIAEIEVTDYGLGIEAEIRNRLRDLCHKGIAAIYLHLPLGDPQTAELCRRFEESGFLFAGILPQPADPAGQEGTPTKDQLCLQYLNGPRVNYDWLKIYSDFGRELMGYVRALDPLG